MGAYKPSTLLDFEAGRPIEIEAISRSTQSRMQMTVRNLQRAVRVNLPALRASWGKIARTVMAIPQTETTQLQRLSEISVLLISDRRMSALHRQFLNQAGPTDVITFDHGEIFISAETARRNAGAFGNSLLRELQLYIIHGLLHLHGFDDEKASDARKMKRTQEKILATLN